MWQSFKEYVLATGRWGWIILVDILLGGAGAYLDISGTWGLPRWVWVTMVGVGVLFGPFIAFHKVRKQRDEARSEVASVISELESEIISVSGQSTNMARLFWTIGRYFLRGIKPDGVFWAIDEAFQGPLGEESKEVTEAEQNLMYKLRVLQVIRDEQRLQGLDGYGVIVATSLGASVIKELAKKWGDSPWPKTGSRKYGFD